MSFSEPMDPASVQAFQSFELEYGTSPNPGNPLYRRVVGNVLPSVDLLDFTLEPAQLAQAPRQLGAGPRALPVLGQERDPGRERPGRQPAAQCPPADRLHDRPGPARRRLRRRGARLLLARRGPERRSRDPRAVPAGHLPGRGQPARGRALLDPGRPDPADHHPDDRPAPEKGPDAALEPGQQDPDRVALHRHGLPAARRHQPQPGRGGPVVGALLRHAAARQLPRVRDAPGPQLQLPRRGPRHRALARAPDVGSLAQLRLQLRGLPQPVRRGVSDDRPPQGRGLSGAADQHDLADRTRDRRLADERRQAPRGVHLLDLARHLEADASRGPKGDGVDPD